MSRIRHPLRLTAALLSAAAWAAAPGPARAGCLECGNLLGFVGGLALGAMAGGLNQPQQPQRRPPSARPRQQREPVAAKASAPARQMRSATSGSLQP